MLKINDELRVENNNILFLTENYIDSLTFLRKIVGIYQSDIKYNDTLVYDNKEYFEKRVYLENNIDYINSLSARQINNNINKLFNKEIDINKFKKLINDTKVRLNLKKDLVYNFDSEKKNIVNLCLLLSFNGNYKIMPEIYKYIKDLSVIKEINKAINNDSCLISSANLENIKKYDFNKFDLYFLYEEENNIKTTKLNKSETYYKVNTIIHKDEYKYIVYKDEDSYILDYSIKDNNELYKSIKSSLTKLDMEKYYE